MRDVYLKCLECGMHWTIKQLDQRNENLKCDDVIFCSCGNSAFEIVLLEDSNA